MDNQQGGNLGPKNQSNKRKNRSLFCFSLQNPVRRFFRWLTQETDERIGYLDKFILIAIAVSIIQMAFDDPLMDPLGKKQKVLNYIEYVVTTLFLIEAIIKSIANGFLFNGRKSYLR
jgi:hypothetical protein